MRRLTSFQSLLMMLVLATILPRQSLSQEALPKLVKKIQPSVITIVTYDAQGNQRGQGSGFFINDHDHFVTNYHVLAGAALAEVITYDGLRYPIKELMAWDRIGDLIVAVIGRPVRETSSDGKVQYLGGIYSHLKISGIMPEVGEKVAVVGSPLGLEQTLSDGVVSAIRSFQGLGDILQISAPISPGSSGSPVVNLKGEVIGVATLQIARGQNLNFAIPGFRVLAIKKRGETYESKQRESQGGMFDEFLQQSPKKQNLKPEPDISMLDLYTKYYNQGMMAILKANTATEKNDKIRIYNEAIRFFDLALIADHRDFFSASKALEEAKSALNKLGARYPGQGY